MAWGDSDFIIGGALESFNKVMRKLLALYSVPNAGTQENAMGTICQDSYKSEPSGVAVFAKTGPCLSCVPKWSLLVAQLTELSKWLVGLESVHCLDRVIEQKVPSPHEAHSHRYIGRDACNTGCVDRKFPPMLHSDWMVEGQSVLNLTFTLLKPCTAIHRKNMWMLYCFWNKCLLRKICFLYP